MDHSKILLASKFFTNLYPAKEPTVNDLVNLYSTVMRNQDITSVIKIFPLKGVFSKVSGFGATDGSRFLIGSDLLNPEFYKKFGVSGRDLWLVALYTFKAVAYHEAGHCYRYKVTKQTIREQTELLKAKVSNSGLKYDKSLLSLIDNIVEDWVTEQLICPLLDDLYPEIRDIFNEYFFTFQNPTFTRQGVEPLHLIRSKNTREELKDENENLYNIGMKYFDQVLDLTFSDLTAKNLGNIRNQLQEIKFEFYKELIDSEENQKQKEKDSKKSKDGNGDGGSITVDKIIGEDEADNLTSGVIKINGVEIDLSEVNNSLVVGGTNSEGTKVAKIPQRGNKSDTTFVKKLLPLVRELRKEKNAISNIRNQAQGRLDKIVDVFFTDSVYRDPRGSNNVSYPKRIVVLLDVSGSTRSGCSKTIKSEYNAETIYQSFINAGFTLGRIFKELGIPHAIISHTTDWGSRSYCKIYTLQNYLTKELPRGEFWNYHENMNNAGNSDAAALEFAHKIAKDGLVIVISDGLPSDSHLVNVDPEEALKITTKKIVKKGGKLVAIGLDSNLSERLEEFYPYVVNMEKGNAIRKIIQKIFGK